MPKVDLVAPQNFKLLVHGETGVGKTFLAGTAGLVKELCPVLFFDFEDGRISILRVPGLTEHAITFWSVEDQKDLDTLEKAMKSPEPFKTVVVDSLTEMYALMMSVHLKSQGRAENPPQIQDYGFVTYRILRFLRMIKEYGKANFIATAGTALTKDEIDGSIHYEPDITGKMNFRVARYFDIVGSLSVKINRPRGGAASAVRQLQVQPYGRVRAKDRTGALGLAMLNPTAQKLYDAFRGKEIQ